MALEQAEIHFDSGLDGDRFAVLLARSELPFFDSFDGLLVQTEAQGTDDFQVARLAVFVHHDKQHHGALELSFPSFFGVFGLDLKDQLWGRNATADPVCAAAHISARTGAEPSAGTGTNAAALTGADATA